MTEAKDRGVPQLVTEGQSREPLTFLEVLDDRAQRFSDRNVFTFLRDGELEADSITFGDLRARALAVAARLTTLNAPGERAILVYPQGLEFIVAFFGCLYAGVIPVPASLPNRKRGLESLRGIAANAGAKWLLSTGALLEELTEDVVGDPVLAAMSFLDAEQPPFQAPEGWERPSIDPSTVALLQYTSGSTGSPRGVVVTHANLVANHRQLQLSFDHDESTVLISWLPMFHDMGLGTILMTVWATGRCYLMSPGAFVQNPRRWLQAISHYRGTSSLAPDFAYDLCVRRLAKSDRAGLDLSSWRMAANGSEPVRASTIDRFVDAFGPCGFRRQTFQPGYGLAEATLFVSSGHPSEQPVVRFYSPEKLKLGIAEQVQVADRGQALVSSGHVWLDTELRIVDPDTHEECKPGRIGEIWIKGTSVAAGYWANEAESEQTFRARTGSGQGPFLRTGDLGFIEDGDVFVTGRHKDLIIVRGRNYYPQDIENSVSGCHPALVAHGCAAFSIDSDQGEQVVIVQEVMRTALRTLDTAAVIRAIRSVVSDRHALHTHAVVLVKPSTLPRTTSGKMRRKSCRQSFLDKSIPSVASWYAPMPQASDTDSDPDSHRRESAARADRLIDWLRRHAADLISAYAGDERRTVPAALLRDLGKQGLMGMQIAADEGGLGFGHTEVVRVIDQLASSDFALALFVGLNNHLGIQPVAKYATPAIKAVLLPGLAHGEELAAFAYEEPGSRKAPGSVALQADADGEDRWQLFGTKYLDGAVQGASIITVFAHHDEPPGVSAFVVSSGVDGLRQVHDGLSLGVLGISRDSIVLDGVRIGRENLLGNLGAGIDIAREAMMHTRLAIGAACVGGMKRCVQVANRGLPYYGTVNGKLTPNPVTLARLGSITARVAALECLVHRVANAIDAGQAVPPEAFAACKILGPELLLRSIDDLMQLGVTGGFAETNRISALYRDAGLLRNFDGPPETVAELTGAVLMEGDASLRLLIEDVFHAPEVVRWISPVMQAVRYRMMNLSGALARRAQRWGHTRAGELATWLALLAAVDCSRRAKPSAELERALAWAKAQLEYALSSVRFGTPSETATLDTSDVAASFAAYSTSMADLGPALAGQDDPLQSPGAWAPPVAGTGKPRASASVESSLDSSRRELRSWIISWLASRLQIAATQVEPGRSFADHGLDSLAAVELAKGLSDRLGRELDATLLWSFATIDSLVEHLISVTEAAPSESAKPPEPSTSSIQPPESRLDDELALLEKELRSRSRS